MNRAGSSDDWIARCTATMNVQISVGPRSAPVRISPGRLWVRSVQARRARSSRYRTIHPISSVIANVTNGHTNCIGSCARMRRIVSISQ